MARKLHHWQITSYAYKKDPSGSTAPGIDYHNQKKTALLDDPEPFLENAGHYEATVDTPAKKLNESYFEHPMSGDDIAKMGGRRISMKPTLKHFVDVPQDLDYYQAQREAASRREAQNAETPPDRGSDPSRRPDMGMSGPEQRARYA